MHLFLSLIHISNTSSSCPATRSASRTTPTSCASTRKRAQSSLSVSYTHLKPPFSGHAPSDVHIVGCSLHGGAAAVDGIRLVCIQTELIYIRKGIVFARRSDHVAGSECARYLMSVSYTHLSVSPGKPTMMSLEKVMPGTVLRAYSISSMYCSCLLYTSRCV